MALGAVAAQRRLAQHENDSISSALATIWGDYIRNKAAKDGPEITAEYMRGIDSALRMALADDAFYQGLEEGVTMVNRIRQVEKMGEFKVDLGLFGFRLQQIAKGKNVGFTEKSANRYLNWFVGMTEAKRQLVEGSKPFLEAKAKEEGIEKRPSGLLFEVITEGEGGGGGVSPFAAKAMPGGDFAFMYGSDFATADYTVKEKEEPVVETVATPTFSVAAGEVAEGTKVSIACATEGAVIYYTVDNSEPTAESTEYKEAITIDKAMTVKAIAVKGEAKSEVAVAAYTVKTANEDEELAGVSVYPNPSNGLFNIELPVAATIEVFASNGVLTQRISANAGVATLNINRSGIYFLRITGEGRSAIKRVIVR